MTPWSTLSIHVEISFAFAELKESITSQRSHMEWKRLLPAAVLLSASSVSTTMQWPRASQPRDHRPQRFPVKYHTLLLQPLGKLWEPQFSSYFILGINLD